MPKGGGCFCCGSKKQTEGKTKEQKPADKYVKDGKDKPATKPVSPVVPVRTKETQQGASTEQPKKPDGAGSKRNPALLWPAAGAGDAGLAIVVDVGSGTCKAGPSNEKEPLARFSSIIGDPRASSHWVILNANKRASFIGEDAPTRRGVLRMRNPIQRGVVNNWDDMEEIWQYLFDEVLHMRPKDYPILLTDPSPESTHNREKMVQIMFEMFNATEIYVAVPAMLSLYATGRTTGVVLDSGEGVSSAVPVHEGYLLRQGMQHANLAGSDITDLLTKSLAERGDIPTREMVRRIKEVLCYVAKDYDKEVKTANGSCLLQGSYTLPDGRTIIVNNERFHCPELLFQPSLVGSKEAAIPKLINNAITACDADARKDLYSNILLSGGNTALRDFDDRLACEMKKLAPNVNDIRVHAPLEREYSAWLGGSVLASQSAFKKMWITRKDYEEEGKVVVRKKCF